TKKRRRTESDSIANAGKKIGQAQASIAAAGSALVLQGAVAQFQPAVDGLKAVLHAENVRLVVPLKDLRRDLQPETIACLSRLAVARHRESGDTLAPARYMLDTQRTVFAVRICLISARQVPARTGSHLETAGRKRRAGPPERPYNSREGHRRGRRPGGNSGNSEETAWEYVLPMTVHRQLPPLPLRRPCAARRSPHPNPKIASSSESARSKPRSKANSPSANCARPICARSLAPSSASICIKSACATRSWTS